MKNDYKRYLCFCGVRYLRILHNYMYADRSIESIESIESNKSIDRLFNNFAVNRRCRIDAKCFFESE